VLIPIDDADVPTTTANQLPSDLIATNHTEMIALRTSHDGEHSHSPFTAHYKIDDSPTQASRVAIMRAKKVIQARARARRCVD
jgi:hypothetical protein